DIKLSTAYKTYLDYATRKVPPKKARKFKKPASPKLKTVPASPKEPTQKGKRVIRPAKKATTAPTTGVVIRDTPGNVNEKLKLQASDSSEGADFESEVPDEPIGKPKDTSEGTEESDDVNDEDDNDDDNEDDEDDSGNDDDGGNDAQDSKWTDSDDDENPSFSLKDYEEEETQEDKYVHTPEKDKSNDEEKMYEEEDDDVEKELYGDLNITQGLRDIDMTNVEQGNVNEKLKLQASDSSEGADFESEVLDEPIGKPKDTSEGTGEKPGVLDVSKDSYTNIEAEINLHTVHDDTLLGTLKFVSKTEDYQKYGALIPDGMINQDIKLSTAYKTYLDYATRKVPPKKARKFKKPASPKL
nr:hypothetical protein [Tanacetum cinerariifolium]